MRVPAGSAHPRCRAQSLVTYRMYVTDHSVQPQELLGRERLTALQHLARSWIGVSHLAPLLIGEREHVEHEELIDLTRVEEIARALRCDARIVVQDDRRGEHRVV